MRSSAALNIKNVALESRLMAGLVAGESSGYLPLGYKLWPALTDEMTLEHPALEAHNLGNVLQLASLLKLAYQVGDSQFAIE